MLTVTAAVPSTCSLSGGPTLHFGSYTSGQAATIFDVNGTVNYVNYGGNLSFTLDGGGAATSITARWHG